MPNKNRDYKLSECLELFREWKGIAVSPRSLYIYMSHLKAFVNWMGDKKVSQIDDELILKYIISMQGRYSEATIAYRAIALRLFFRFLNKRGMVSFAWDLIQVPQYRSTHYYTPTHLEIQETIKNIQGNTFQALRDRTLIHFLYASGVRVSEAADFAIENYIPGKLHAVIQSKKKRSRTYKKRRIIMWDKQTDALMNEYAKLRQISTHTNAFFIATDRRCFGGKLTTRTMQRIIARYRVNPNMSCHSLRHRYGTDLARCHVHVSTAADLMGHNDVMSTANIYMDMDDPDILKAGKKVYEIRNKLTV